MKDKQQLEKTIKDLRYKIRNLEKERMTTRDFKHKELLINLKKQRLQAETQLNKYNEQIS